MTFDDEPPTRPDLPRFIPATRCVHCGRVFSEHQEMFPLDIEAQCMGLKEYFAPSEIS
jgi:hypothetical protein